MTNSTANVSHDGAGHLVLRSPHSGSDPATGWTPRPTSGEVDILEDINGRSSVFGTLHCGTSPGGPCNESTGIGSGERACAG